MIHFKAKYEVIHLKIKTYIPIFRVPIHINIHIEYTIVFNCYELTYT